MKKIFLAFSLICLSNAAFTQQDGLYFKLKVPLQCDVQRATEVFSYGSEIKKGHAVNFGVDALIEYQKNAFFRHIIVYLYAVDEGVKLLKAVAENYCFLHSARYSLSVLLRRN